MTYQDKRNKCVFSLNEMLVDDSYFFPNDPLF